MQNLLVLREAPKSSHGLPRHKTRILDCLTASPTVTSGRIALLHQAGIDQAPPRSDASVELQLMPPRNSMRCTSSYCLKKTVTAVVLSCFIAGGVSAMTSPTVTESNERVTIAVDRTHKG